MLSRGKNSQAVSSYVDGDPSEQVYAPMVASDHVALGVIVQLLS